MSFRTSKIDSDIKKALLEKGFKQVCVLGAGLDTRPWRLETGLSKDEVKYFEVDFPEIFHYKLPILQKNGAVELVDYCKVEADLSLPSWLEQLEQAGFKKDIPTIWLLEGLTGYLTEEELRLLFKRVTELSARGSEIVATFLTPRVTKLHIGLHRFYPDDPLTFVREFGWTGTQTDTEYYAIALGRAGDPDTAVRNYFIVNASI